MSHSHGDRVPVPTTGTDSDAQTRPRQAGTTVGSPATTAAMAGSGWARCGIPLIFIRGHATRDPDSRRDVTAEGEQPTCCHSSWILGQTSRCATSVKSDTRADHHSAATPGGRPKWTRYGHAACTCRPTRCTSATAGLVTELVTRLPGTWRNTWDAAGHP